uniref:Protein kinase domain-containing protein n=1 Tax=Fusarium oxysporum (strain Fo5176) TaxID=660025 RepID=A0A0D2YF27_FUSOF
MQGTWIRKRKIGKGGFGIVWLENHLDSSRAVAVRAVKQIRKSSLSNRPERELQVIAKFSQEPPFITCYGWYENNDSLFIAMEFLNELMTSLAILLSSEHRASSLQRLSWHMTALGEYKTSVLSLLTCGA